MRIYNRIQDCSPAKSAARQPQRALTEISIIMLHRTAVADTAAETALWHRTNGEGIGSMPYTLFIRESGMIEQALPLQTMSPHAWTWNRRALGVGIKGDFQERQATRKQVNALRYLLPLLYWAFCSRLWTVDASVVGHTEMPRATKHKNKVCPGPYLNIGCLHTLIKCEEPLDPEDAKAQLLLDGLCLLV